MKKGFAARFGLSLQLFDLISRKWCYLFFISSTELYEFFYCVAGWVAGWLPDGLTARKRKEQQ